MDLKDRLAQFRAEEQRLSWEGTFLDYFEIVKARPSVAGLAHARVHDMIVAQGHEQDEEGRKVFGFFKHDIFGVEHPLEQLVEYFSSAAKRLEVRKRILLLMGPVGGGKSTIVSLLKRGMEKYSRSDEGAIYSIKGCPMHEEPLHLIPHELREEVYRQFGIYIEGDLCPACRQMLQDQYGGRPEDVIVKRISFSEKNRVGIGTFTPSDPKSQDISELTGSVDLSTIGQYGSESDPRAYRFDGELNVANRGLMEFIEMLKCDEKFLYGLLTLSQEQVPEARLSRAWGLFARPRAFSRSKTSCNPFLIGWRVPPAARRLTGRCAPIPVGRRMQTNTTALRYLLTCLLLIGLTAAGPVPPARAAAACTQRSVDLMLVLDDSGSMGAGSEEHNDPDNLRITAAHLMLDLLDPDDRVGLVLFSDTLRETAPLGTSRSVLHGRINQFRSAGGTRLDLAVQAGLDQLGAQSDRPRALLLLTDGRPDEDPAGQAARLANLADRAGQSGVALYVIGLGPNYDRALLEQLTSVSKSEQLWHVIEAGQLSDAFLEILRNLKGLNIESSTGGDLPVLGLSPEVRFAALRRQGAPVTAIDWSGGSLTGQAAAPSLPAGVTYTYDLLSYKPKSAGPGTARSQAPVVWKLERPPVEAQFTAPTARAEVDSGEPLPVSISLTPCDGAALPQGIKGTVTVLDANRKPTPNQANLTLQDGALAGDLPIPGDAGPYVLNARILTAEGRQVTVAEQTVIAAPHDRWVIEAPPTLTTGAASTITLRHRFGGKPAAATPDSLTATLPDGTTATLPLQPAGDPGVWTANVAAPPDKTGRITFVLGDGKAKATTDVEPIRLVLQDLPTLIWKFQGNPVKLTLTGKTTGPVSGPAVLPPYTTAAGTVDSGQWRTAGGAFTADAEFRLQDKPSWWSLTDLFIGRRVDLKLVPAPGPYIQADSATVTGWVEPLLPWYWVLAGFAVTLLLGAALNYRLHGGPQLPVAIAAGGGQSVYLMARRPGALTRLMNTRTQREITVGGPASKAAVQLKELPPDALVKIVARGIPGRERFRVENLNKQHAMVFREVFQRSRISLKGKGPAPALSVGGVPLRLDLHPKQKRGN